MSDTPNKKYATGKSFSVKVCDAVRHHVGMRKALESKRSAAMEDRDAAVAELDEISDKHGKDALKVKERHSDAVVQIDQLQKRIRWHSNQVDELVEKADEEQFDFMYEPPAEVLSTPRPAVEKAQLKLADDSRPVGRPRKGTKDPEPPEGEDQHLVASVNELDLRENLKGKLIKAGLETVLQLSRFLAGGGDIEARADVAGHYAQEIRDALEKYKKAHRKAAASAERSAS